MARHLHITIDNKERGAALLIVLAASGIASILLFFTNDRVSKLAQSSHHYDLEEQKDSLALMLRETTDCTQTLAPFSGVLATCVGQWINLRRANNTIAVSAEGTQINRWTALAQCTAGGIQVFAVRPRPGRSPVSTNSNDFFRDPVVDLPLNITRGSSANVYHHGAPLLCSTAPPPLRYRTGKLTWSGNASITVDLEFRPKAGICGVSRFDYDNATSQQCICTAPTIGEKSVQFPVQKTGSGGLGCEANYMIFGE